MDLLLQMATLVAAGYSVVSAIALFGAFALLLPLPGKSAYSLGTCAALLGSLTTIQIHHVLWAIAGDRPLESTTYLVALFLAPPTFYLFGRWVLFPTEPSSAARALHLLPLVMLFLVHRGIALPILFTLGVGYSLWLGNVVYGLRDRRRHYRFEFLFFALMSAFAVVVLVLGFSLPYVDVAYFYRTYALTIAFAFAILTVALIAKPDLLGDLVEAARVKYGASTLREVDVEACLRKLDVVMHAEKAYQDPELSLASLAERVGLSAHQLSELVNSRLGVGFSRWVREQRVAAAKQLLLRAPGQSVLSVGMETGFRSQSSFYAAFKEVTGVSPGEFRRAQGRSE